MIIRSKAELLDTVTMLREERLRVEQVWRRLCDRNSFLHFYYTYRAYSKVRLHSPRSSKETKVRAQICKTAKIWHVSHALTIDMALPMRGMCPICWESVSLFLNILTNFFFYSFCLQ